VDVRAADAASSGCSVERNKVNSFASECVYKFITAHSFAESSSTLTIRIPQKNRLSSLVGCGLPCSLVVQLECIYSINGSEEKLLVTDQKHSSEPNCRVLGLSTQHSSCMTACGVTCIANSTLAIHHKPVCVRNYVCVCMCVYISVCTCEGIFVCVYVSENDQKCGHTKQSHLLASAAQTTDNVTLSCSESIIESSLPLSCVLLCMCVLMWVFATLCKLPSARSRPSMFFLIAHPGCHRTQRATHPVLRPYQSRHSQLNAPFSVCIRAYV
jgi:hypothetical protein